MALTRVTGIIAFFLKLMKKMSISPIDLLLQVFLGA